MRREADLVWEVDLGGERLLLHVEMQTNPDSAIGERLAEYGLRLWRRDHLPVRSVVVYLREAGPIPASPFVFGRGGGEEALRYRYGVMRLWHEPPERVLAAEPGLWPLVTVAERLAQAPLEQAERRELTALLATLAGVRLPRRVVDQLLRRNLMLRELLAESSVAEILREEGEARGRVEGKRELVRAMLEGRFGELDAEEAAALRTAEEPVLLALAAHLTTDSREQVRARLRLT